MRSHAEIEKLISDWEALRADYVARGASGIVDFINIEIRKLKAELASAKAPKPKAH